MQLWVAAARPARYELPMCIVDHVIAGKSVNYGGCNSPAYEPNTGALQPHMLLAGAAFGSASERCMALPVVTAAHKARIEIYIQMGVDESAELVVDGRGFTLRGMDGVQLWTKRKAVTGRWPDSGVGDAGSAFVIPTMG